jgi:hypothetical protein
MKCLIMLVTFVALAAALAVFKAACQIEPATEAVARELIEVMLRQGGREAVTELAEMGGQAAVRKLLERAMNQGGKELVERITHYATRYGPSALKAVERSPSQMIQALDGLPPDLVAPAIRAAAREPRVTAQLVAAFGQDALELAAKHPGVGTSLAEKLGEDGIHVGQQLSTDQAVTFARYADDIAALPPGERNQLLDAMIRAPAKVLDYLETHPKVLLTAGGVALVIAAKDNLLGSPTFPTNQGTPPPGLIERVIFGLGDRFAWAVGVIIAIIVGGILCRVAIGVRSAWKLKALRLEQEEARAATEAIRQSNASRC